MTTTDIHQFLELNSFPKSYAACHLKACTKNNCLHRIFGTLLPQSVTFGKAILPSALEEANRMDGQCRHYSPAVTHRCYAGFDHLFDDVKKKDLIPLRQAIYDYMNGRSNFYRYSNAEEGYLLTQEKADRIADIFGRFGYSAPTYAHTFMAYKFRL